MEEKITFWEIVKGFESRWFMSVMSTGAVGVFTQFMAKYLHLPVLKQLADFFVYLALFLVVVVSFVFVLRVVKFFDQVIKDLKHPVAANFFAGINISFAVLTTAILNVLIPNNSIEHGLGITLAEICYLISLVVGISLLVIVPVMLIISKKVETKHALGIWFLPPVGMFVVAFAGNFLAMHGILKEFIMNFNFFLFGPALMLYILILNLIYYRLKFHPLPAPEVAPSFVIGLAPIGVSVIAFLSYVKLLKSSGDFFIDVHVFKTFVEIYSVLIYGFGFWWFAITMIILGYYLVKHKIPYTLGFWAFVFPLAAFGIGLMLVGEAFKLEFIVKIAVFVWLLVMVVWSFVFIKTLISVATKKAFIRPKVIN